MFKKTVRLFVKALIIGTLLSIGLRQVPIQPLPVDKNASQYEQQQPFQQPDIDCLSG